MAVGTLHLNREDSINLVRNLFNPTEEEIVEHNRLREERNKNIDIKRNDTGFEIEVETRW